MAAFAFAPAIPGVHQPLLTFLAALNADIGAGTSVSFLTSLGRRLVLGHVLREQDFPKTGAPSPADLGILMNTLHALGHLVDWASITTQHADETAFMTAGGAALFSAVETAL